MADREQVLLRRACHASTDRIRYVSFEWIAANVWDFLTADDLCDLYATGALSLDELEVSLEELFEARRG